MLSKKTILIGFFWSILISVSLLCILILLVHFTNISEASLPTITYAIHIISILTGSIIGGIRSGQKGWYTGGIIGLSYMLFMIIAGSLLFTNIAFHFGALFQTLVGAFIGMVGGIVGVNFSAK